MELIDAPNNQLLISFALEKIQNAVGIKMFSLPHHQNGQKYRMIL